MTVTKKELNQVFDLVKSILESRGVVGHIYLQENAYGFMVKTGLESGGDSNTFGSKARTKSEMYEFLRGVETGLTFIKNVERGYLNGLTSKKNEVMR